MAVMKHGSFFAQSVCKLGHVRKDPVLYQRRHMLHVSHYIISGLQSGFKVFDVSSVLHIAQIFKRLDYGML
jgi:hypothetical protein